MDTILSLKSVTKRFGGLVANDKITFNVKTGQVFGLIGPNGAGKTTLFNCITGHLLPDEGKILFKGSEIHSLDPTHTCLLGIGRTFQVVKPFSGMTVLENVMTGAFARTNNVRIAKEKAMDALNFTGLIKKKDMLPTNITLVDKKALELTRALATEPELIMLDEVFAGLTPTERKEVLNIVERIKGKGITILMIEHVMEVVMNVAERIVVLDYGKVIAEGTPQEVSENEDVIKAYLGGGHDVKN